MDSASVNFTGPTPFGFQRLSRNSVPSTPSPSGLGQYGTDSEGQQNQVQRANPAMHGFGLQGGQVNPGLGVPATPTPPVETNTFGYGINVFGPIPNQPQWNYPQHGTPVSSRDPLHISAQPGPQASAETPPAPTPQPPTPLSANSSFSATDSNSNSNSNSNGSDETGLSSDEDDDASRTGKKRAAENTALGKTVSKMARIKARHGAFSKATRDLHTLGRILGRLGSVTDNLQDVITDGRYLRINDPDLSAEDRRMAKVWKYIETFVPNINERIGEVIFLENGLSAIAKQLDAGRQGVRSTDTNRAINYIGLVYTFKPILPAEKVLRGFAHDHCFVLLSPITFNIDDPEVVAEIRDGTLIMVAGDYPRLLYPEGKPVALTDDDLLDGFLLSEILIKMAILVLFGCNAAKDPNVRARRVGSCWASRNGIKEVTPEFIAYIAVLTRYAISSDTMLKIDGDEGYPYEALYSSLVVVLEAMDEKDRNDIFAFWNGRLFTATKLVVAARMSEEALEFPHSSAATRMFNLVQSRQATKASGST